MSASKLCPHCRQPIPDSAPEGACPVCLLQMAVDISTSQSAAGAFAAPTIEDLNSQIESLDVLKLIGCGGMSAVFLARQKMLNRDVALKILPRERARDPEFVERFLREATALAKLNHPHIVNVFDAGRSRDYLYIVMEYVDGVNLRALIQDGRLLPDEAMHMVRQICEAMQYVHDQGLVHRDIKPENVLVDQQGRIKVADFGLAKLTEQDAHKELGLTQTNIRMGTMGYMSPEQFTNTAAVDHRTDIYSLGVMFYEMLTGELPTLEFKRPSQKIDVDPRVDRVVERSTRESPDDRYQQAVEVRKDVERIASTPRVNTRYIVAALVLIVAGILGAGFWNWQKDRRIPVAAVPQPTIPEAATKVVMSGRAQRIRDLFEQSLANQPRIATEQPVSGLTDAELVLSHVLTSPDWEWSEPVRLLNEDESIKSFAPDISQDGLHLVFTTEESPDNRAVLREMHRSALDEAWKAPSSLASAFPSVRVFGAPCISRDGTVLLFNSPDFHPAGSGSHDIWMATRKSPSEAWGDASPLGKGINSHGRDWSPFMTNDGLTLMWAADRALTGETDLWMARRASVDESFGEPQSLGAKVNSPAMENNPKLTADERVLVFASSRDYPQGPMILYFSVREHRDAPWSTPINAGDRINLAGSDTHATIAPDGRTMILSWYGDGKATLWTSQRVPRPMDSSPLPTEAEVSTKTDAELAASHILTSPEWEWTEPQQILEPINTDVFDYLPSISGDGLELAFASTRSPDRKVYIWHSTRTSESAPWSPATQVNVQAESDFQMSSPCISGDHLVLLFDNGSSHPEGSGGDDIWIAKRESASDTWGQPVPFGKDINWSGRDWNPSLGHDGLTLLWCTDRPGGFGEMDLWMSERDSKESPFGAPRNLGPRVNSPAREYNPELSADELALIFSIERAPSFHEMMVCIRESRKAQWSRPIKLYKSVDSPKWGTTATITADCKTLIFTKGDQTSSSLWMTQRVPKKLSDLLGTGK